MNEITQVAILLGSATVTFLIGLAFGLKKGVPKNKWKHLMSNDTYDWFYCPDSLDLACQKLDLNTGYIIERTIFTTPPIKKTKNQLPPKAPTIAKG